MAGSGPVGINGLPRPSEAEYEENGRLYSTFRRYVNHASFRRNLADRIVASTCCRAMNSRKIDSISFTEY